MTNPHASTPHDAAMIELLRRAGYVEADGTVRRSGPAPGFPGLGHVLERSKRALVGAWWHPDDRVGALEILNGELAAQGIESGLTAEALDAAMDALEAKGVDDDEDQRRHQIGMIARHANAALAAEGRPERFRAFNEEEAGWESDEPVWLRVTPEEHALLIGVTGAPTGIEASWDDEGEVDPIAAQTPQQGPRVPRDPNLAYLFAGNELAARRYETALAAAEIGVGAGAHGVLAELVRIEALLRLGRRDDAIGAWNRTATSWLAGERKAWDTQWQKLAALHAEIGLPEDSVIDAVRARR